MVNKVLLDKMEQYEHIGENDLYVKKVNISSISLRKIRDFLLVEGGVLEEDLSNKCYIAYLKIGVLRINRTLVGIMIDGDQLIVCGYTRKNFMSKKDNKDTVDYIYSQLVLNKKSNKRKYLTIFILVIASLLIGFELMIVKPAINSTKQYNLMIDKFNQKAEEYNKKIKLVSTDNIKGVPSKVQYLNKEKSGYLPVSLSIIKGNSKNKIDNDKNTVSKMVKTMNDSEQIVSQIDNPSVSWVENRLKNIKEIKQIEHVEKNNDPNGLLEKEHGYIACTYFIVDGIDMNGNNSSPIKLGTDGGGCVEIYSNLGDAKKRCEYLKEFDGTYLYTGSYALIGTMVVRTSYVLNEDQQYLLTDKIFKELVKKDF